MKTTFDFDEKTFDDTITAIEDLLNTFKEDVSFLAPDTGELFEVKELRRVHGILTGLRNIKEWETVLYDDKLYSLE